jgi:hypothetical protein
MGDRVVSAQQYPRIPLIAWQLRSRRFPGPGLRALLARASNPPASAKYRGIGAAALTRDRVQWPQIRAQRLQEAFWRAEGGVGPLAGFPDHKPFSGAARRQLLTSEALHCPAPQDDRITRGRSPCGWGNRIVPARSPANIVSGGNMTFSRTDAFPGQRRLGM